MIDLHTHSLLSDGLLLPSELVHRAQVSGYSVIAVTDHVDSSNIDFILPRLIKVAGDLNKYWSDKIKVIPGVEITHVPLELIPELIDYARSQDNVLVVVHGESPVEPVIEGTNRAAIEARCDILAHPGWIDDSLASLAKEQGVALEITARAGHREANKHVYEVGKKNGALLVFNSDTHSPDDLLNELQVEAALKRSLNLSIEQIEEIESNSFNLAKRFI
ncbi:MAG: histidinol phosphate phosphatase domain-containing protein [Candidatus Kaelpia aquatica]|nr:histidinol phosphate phosphatase domain-containing protein [Candidatus Kaelpia aquatica]